MEKKTQTIILILIACLFLFPFITGCVGERGHIGAQGPAGPAGANGTPGGGGSGLMNQTSNMTPNMTAGPQGIQGLQGIQGDLGPTGATGSAGATGATGAQGIPGPDNDAWYLWVNGTRAMTGIFNAGGFNLSNLLNPVANQDAATKSYVDTVANGKENTLTTGPLGAWTPIVLTQGVTGYLIGTSVDIWLKNDISEKVISIETALTDSSTALPTSSAVKLYVDTAVAGASGGDTSQFLFLNGTRSMAGILNMDGYNITQIKTIEAGSDVVNKSWVEARQLCGATYAT